MRFCFSATLATTVALWLAIVYLRRFHGPEFLRFASASVPLWIIDDNDSLFSWIYLHIVHGPARYDDIYGLTLIVQLDIGLSIFVTGGFSLLLAQTLRGSTLKADPEASRLSYAAPDPSGERAVSIHIGDDISKTHVALVKKAVERTKASPNPQTRLRVTIDTHGGSFWDAIEIYNLLQQLSRTHCVIVVVTGNCFSAGNEVLVAVPIDRRFGTKRSRYMVHAARDGRKRTLNSRRTDKIEATLLYERTYLAWPGLEKVVRNGKNHYMSAQKAYALGVIGSII